MNCWIYDIDNLKKLFICIAYITYILITILKNQLHIDLGLYEFIFVGIIGVSLQLAINIRKIQKIIQEISDEKLMKLQSDLTTQFNIALTKSIENNSVRSALISDRIDSERVVNINEPIYIDDPKQTHRDIIINENTILRIKKNISPNINNDNTSLIWNGERESRTESRQYEEV